MRKMIRIAAAIILVASPVRLLADDELAQRSLMTDKPDQNEEIHEPCGHLHPSDGGSDNHKQGFSLRAGPPGVQNGQSNPLGLPPGYEDISFTWVWRCGEELNVELVPGPTFGLRYRKGDYFYGSYGGGILVTANGIGPGVYTTIGANVARWWRITVDFEFKQGLGIAIVDTSKPHLISPYAFRMGAGLWW